MAEITAEYPEVNIRSHPMYKKAIEIFNALPEDERQSVLAYKHAAREAAIELGIKPMSKRTEEELEDYMNVGQGTRVNPRTKRKVTDPKTLLFAEMVGLDITDEKILKGLQEGSEETAGGWMTYKSDRIKLAKEKN